MEGIGTRAQKRIRPSPYGHKHTLGLGSSMRSHKHRARTWTQMAKTPTQRLPMSTLEVRSAP
eukprot:3655988-Alexandrium_andersonii.AAC.1